MVAPVPIPMSGVSMIRQHQAAPGNGWFVPLVGSVHFYSSETRMSFLILIHE